MTTPQGEATPSHPGTAPGFIAPQPNGSPVFAQQPLPQLPTRKPWFKRGWAIAVAAVLVVGGIGALVEQPEEHTTPAVSGSPSPSPLGVSSAEAEASRQAEAEAALQREAEAEASASARAEAEASASAAAEAEAAAAAAAAAAEAALRDPATYSSISRRDWQLIEKDPDSHAGEKYIVYGHVTQADAATGTELFRADTGGAKADWYDYEVNTIVSADADLVSGVVTDDMVRLYVTIIGSFSYDTQIGGSTTAVAVSAGIIEVTGSSND